MSLSKKNLRRALDKKFSKAKCFSLLKRPSRGWIKTIREALGITSTQLAKMLGLTQPRVIKMEQNENNLKISTLEKIAEVLNCEFVYAFIPRQNLESMVYDKAKEKAIKILDNVSCNMAYENQRITIDSDVLNDTIQELLNCPNARLWDDNA